MRQKIKKKAKQVSVFMLASTCAFSMNIAEVFAMEGETVPGSLEVTESVIEPVKTVVSQDTSGSNSSTGGTSTAAPGSGESTENAKPETPSDSEDPADATDPAEPSEPEEPVDPDEPEDTGEPEEPGDVEEPTDPEEPGDVEEPTDPGEAETPKPAEPTIPATPQEPSNTVSPQPAAPNATQVNKKQSKSSTTYRKSNTTKNILSSSRVILDGREKVKYNVSIPISGLPSFITQEMVIGALKCQDETGFPASVTIAQIIQESGFGKYGDGGDIRQGLSYLAFQYNNLFGIKGTGTAGSINMNTGEQTAAGVSYRTTAGFRVYNTYTESIEDRTSLLQRVYSDLIEKATDADSFAMLVGKRWATDISYGQSLIYQMKKYDLYRLDQMTVQQFSELVGTFANPCPGATVTSNFGYRSFRNSFHKGLDLGTGKYNIPTYAASAGTVVKAGWSNSAGNWVVIDHGNGLVTKYMHHDKIYVTVGQHVEKGQQIGLSGTTGDSTGNHLHFQVEENGVAVDPLTYLKL